MMTTYRLSSSQADRIRFDDAITREVDEMFRMEQYQDAGQSGAFMAQLAWDNAAILIEQDVWAVDDVEEARARYLDVYAQAWDAKKQEGVYIDADAIERAAQAGYDLDCERCTATIYIPGMSDETCDDGSGEYIPCPHCGYRHYAAGSERFDRPAEV